MLVLVVLATMAFYTVDEENDKRSETVLDTAEEFPSVIVLELFTSQGCSSCPPADILLDKVKKQFKKEVFALSYHVDYWNYIGWEDPFSKAVYTQKQRKYNSKFNYHSNYTPQLVINGKEHFVGSSTSTMYGKIESYKKKKSSNQVSISTVQSKDGVIAFSYIISGDVSNRLLRAVLVLDEQTTKVKRGENRNRTLKNSNIVVAEKYFDLNASTGSGQIAIPSLAVGSDSMTLMLISENDVTDVTGAAKVKIG